MLESLSKNQIKESSSNLFLLILTLSMSSFFIFGNNRMLAFFITFLILFISLSVLLFYVYKKQRANFELRKKDNIDKLLGLLKEPEKVEISPIVKICDYDNIAFGRNTMATWRTIDTEVPRRNIYGLKRRHFERGLKRQNYLFESDTTKWAHAVGVNRQLSISIIDSSLPALLSQFGEILENDNQIQNYPYTDKDVNNLILRMDICMQNIQGRYITNLYSKEITVVILQSAIDYLKEKHNIPIYGNSGPFVPQSK